VLISFVSAKGSPGVTTTALALGAQWPRTCVVVDVDPFGGDLLPGIGRGTWPADASIVDLVAAARSMPVEAALRQRVVRPAEHGPLALAGFGGLGQATNVPWDGIAAGLAQIADADVLADCGRHTVLGGVEALLARSDVVVLVSGSSLPAVRAVSRLVPVLRETLRVGPGDQRLALLVVDPDEPYGSPEIAQACDLPLLGEVPFDARAAAVWSAGAPAGRWLSRSPLQREAHRLARLLCGSPQGAAVSGGAR
jgi:MinD-like ATPase involved in chromosome partitioning or flagellar assembly